MPINYARPLIDLQGIDAFLENCLGITEELEISDTQTIPRDTISTRIRDAESALITTTNESTLHSKRNRSAKYRDDNARESLRRKILKDLVEMQRLDNDDDINIEQGGARPRGEPRREAKAFIVIGLPASGKSTLVNKTADELGAFILDADYAKRKLPEYDGSFAGANLVHEESSRIVFGESPSLLDLCRTKNYNVVIPKVGNHFWSIEKLRDGLASQGYRVHLCCTVAHRQSAALRAMKRFLITNRYVPLGLIFDGYANDPIMNYYRFRIEEQMRPGKWASLGAYYTEEEEFRCDLSSEENPIFLLKPGKLP